MATAVIMPKAGMAMDEGTVNKWYKAVGDAVTAGEPLLEIETDKVSMDVEAEDDGYLIAILHGPGDVVPVVTPIGYIGKKGEKPPSGGAGGDAVADAGASAAGGVKDEPAPAPVDAAVSAGAPVAARTSAPPGIQTRTTPATPAARRLAREQGVPVSAISGSGNYVLPTGETVGGVVRAHDVGVAGTGSGGEAVRISPLAARVAAENNIDTQNIHGSGSHGRVERRDVEKQIRLQGSGGGAVSAATAGSAASPPPAPEVLPTTPQALAGMRKVIAQRMTHTHQNVPAVTLVRPVGFDALSDVRTQLNEAPAPAAPRISFNDLLSYATVHALLHHPRLNATLTEGAVTYHKSIDIGIAVALDDGLIVPIVRNAGAMSLVEFASAAASVVGAARDGTLGVDDVQNGTFTVTNLGMLNITHFTPIINAPQVAILGFGAPQEYLTLESSGSAGAGAAGDGLTYYPRVRRNIELSLTIDHRILDGAVAAHFLNTLAYFIQNPAALLLYT